ncbi:hypothetical protein, partial [Novosphingobium hassiacum]|uniref:hypothetical protein n=1 Tax=Novosphingobium hassiacum TaxID=173676 RepID=UPI001FEB0A56
GCGRKSGLSGLFVGFQDGIEAVVIEIAHFADLVMPARTRLPAARHAPAETASRWMRQDDHMIDGGWGYHSKLLLGPGVAGGERDP